MTSYSINLHLDRIVISGLDVGPEKAEEIRDKVGSELQRMLSQDGLPEGVSEARVSRLSVPPLRSAEIRETGALAGMIAGGIHSAIRGVR